MLDKEKLSREPVQQYTLRLPISILEKLKDTERHDRAGSPSLNAFASLIFATVFNDMDGDNYLFLDRKKARDMQSKRIITLISRGLEDLVRQLNPTEN